LYAVSSLLPAGIIHRSLIESSALKSINVSMEGGLVQNHFAYSDFKIYDSRQTVISFHIIGNIFLILLVSCSFIDR
jgi:hypothetical protein